MVDDINIWRSSRHVESLSTWRDDRLLLFFLSCCSVTCLKKFCRNKGRHPPPPPPPTTAANRPSSPIPPATTAIIDERSSPPVRVVRHPAIVAIAQLATRGRRIVLPGRDVRWSMSGVHRGGGGVEAMRKRRHQRRHRRRHQHRRRRHRRYVGGKWMIPPSPRARA